MSVLVGVSPPGTPIAARQSHPPSGHAPALRRGGGDQRRSGDQPRHSHGAVGWRSAAGMEMVGDAREGQRSAGVSEGAWGRRTPPLRRRHRRAAHDFDGAPAFPWPQIPNAPCPRQANAPATAVRVTRGVSSPDGFALALRRDSRGRRLVTPGQAAGAGAERWGPQPPLRTRDVWCCEPALPGCGERSLRIPTPRGASAPPDPPKAPAPQRTPRTHPPHSNRPKPLLSSFQFQPPTPLRHAAAARPHAATCPGLQASAPPADVRDRERPPHVDPRARPAARHP